MSSSYSSFMHKRCQIPAWTIYSASPGCWHVHDADVETGEGRHRRSSSGLTPLDLQPFELNSVRWLRGPPPNIGAWHRPCRLSTFHIRPFGLLSLHEKQNIRHR